MKSFAVDYVVLYSMVGSFLQKCRRKISQQLIQPADIYDIFQIFKIGIIIAPPFIHRIRPNLS